MSFLRLAFTHSNNPCAKWAISNAPRSASGSRIHLHQSTPPLQDNKYSDRKTPVEILKHRERMKERFPNGWNPPRKLSREAMDGLRTLHRQDPQMFSTPVLAERFRISPEAVRRILKSKWMPSKAEKATMLQRERRRKEEYVAKSIERERADKWEQLDRLEKPDEWRRRERDEFTLV